MQGWFKTVQDFIATDEGRWAIVGVVGAVVFLLILNSALKRWRRGQHQQANLELLEDMATFAPAPPLPAQERPLVLYGLPVRVRLIVLGPLGKDAGELQEQDVGPVVEQIVPGLKDRLQVDLPRVRLWPNQLSHNGFVAAFRRNTQLPQSDDRIKRWVIIVGKVLRDGSPVAVGLALQSNEANTLGPVVLQHAHQWMEILRFNK
ncbi:MAG TPA: hypothetical protein PLN21_18485 [Gemmatales bacterium]|nr:hypothetical protein [Gemmatales bacterium]